MPLLKVTLPNSSESKTKLLLGRLRMEKEQQQMGCLLMLTGFAEIVQPLTWIAGLVNGFEDSNGNFVTVTSGLPFATLIGYLCCVAIGVLAVLVGYAAALHNAGHPKLSLGVSVFVQTAYILTVSTCMAVTRIASSGNNFDKPPGSLVEPQAPNAQLLAAMGVLAILAYWFGMLGSISMLLGSLQKFQENKPEERGGNYYRGRLFFYSFILFLGGFSQLVVGTHLENVYKCKGGPLPNGAIVNVAMYLIRYPSLAITVGLVQMINGVWGMLRQFRVVDHSQKDHGGGAAFVCSIWLGWLVQLVLQNMVQPSILPLNPAAAAPPTLTAFAFGMNFMPAFLDSKANSLPHAENSRQYYGLPEEEDNDDDDDPPASGVEQASNNNNHEDGTNNTDNEKYGVETHQDDELNC